MYSFYNTVITFLDPLRLDLKVLQVWYDMSVSRWQNDIKIAFVVSVL